jgi:tetratricopeptide (TPR) repeat protein
MSTDRTIPAMIFTASVLMLIASAHCDVIVLRETEKNGQPKRIVGRIIESQGAGDKEAVLVESEGRRRLLLKSKIARIEPSLNEKELELLDPKMPKQYLQLGIKYAEQADELNDPDARNCARHLLWSAMELDASGAIDAHLHLAQLSEGEEAIQHIIHVLRLDPGNQSARDQLQELVGEQSAQDEQPYEELRQLLRASLKDNRWAPLVTMAKTNEAAAVFGRVETAFPGIQKDLANISIPSDCPTCKGSTRLKCSECRGGRVPCPNCNGRGGFQSSQSSGFTDPATGNLVTKNTPIRVRCKICNGLRTFPCQKCKEGWVVCPTCHAEQRTVIVPSQLRSKLGELSSLLDQPKRSTWARTLLTEKATPFHSIANKGEKMNSPVERQFYRRSGYWQTTP